MGRQIRYDPTTCTYSVPESEMRRLQGRHPYADIAAAIAEAGKHTRAYPENVRKSIETDPKRVLELDLELWLFGPQPQQQAETLAELAKQILLCPTFVREALTGQIEIDLAHLDLERFYRRYRELGGGGFEPAENAAAGLGRLLELCGGQKRLPRLQEIDVRILKHLHTCEFAKKQSDLEAELKVSRAAVDKRLKCLRRLGLIERIRGRAGGEVISRAGERLLEKL
ncbi:MAG: winged helix-turn-helix domain-containing protein [Planctomycetota bacterium]